MLTPAYRPTRAGVHRFPADALPWQATPEPGLRLKVVRYDDERGGFLGQVGFAPMARSGLHQHRGVATSFVIDGGLTDYQGAIGLHEAGINLAGATHDAVAYQNTVLVSRLEEPVVYPRERELLTGLHAGSRHDHIVNPAPEVPPDLNVRVDALPRLQTGVEGVQRQTIFDYAGTGSAHRFVQLHFAPGSRVPAWRAEAAVELWVRGGALAIGGEAAHGNTFVVIEPGASVGIEAPHGALALAWAEAPEAWLEGAADPGPRAVRRSLFGF